MQRTYVIFKLELTCQGKKPIYALAFAINTSFNDSLCKIIQGYDHVQMYPINAFIHFISNDRLLG